MKASALQNSFASGEWSPLAQARIDIDRHKESLALCENYIPTLQGPLLRRPGTKYVETVKTFLGATPHPVRLLPFEFSVTQAYILEVGHQYFRFYMNDGQIVSGGSAYEIVSPYDASDIFKLKFTQSADILYLTHPDFAPRKVSRTDHTAWTVTEIDFQDGPYLPMNTGATTITPSAATGTGITLTASAALFVSTDVGRLVRIRRDSANWGWCKITAFTDSTHVTVDVKGGNVGTGGVTTWRLGLYGETTGYPSTCQFHEDRLWFGAPRDNPLRHDGSQSSDYENFAPTELDGSVIASDAIGISLNANDVNVGRWMTSDEKGLLIGTVGGEWVIRPSNASEALSPTNISAKRATSYGSEDVQALQLGKGTLFLQRTGRKIRELNYFFDVDGFRSTDLTALAEHILESGVVDRAEMQIPQSILWCVRGDGQLAGMTYERDVDNLKAAWHRHILGGTSVGTGIPAVVESAAAIPSPDGSYTEIWFVVKRVIGDFTWRYIERMEKIFDDTVDQRHGYHVDCGLTYDNPLAIEGITVAAPPVLTITGHGFTTGDKVLITDIVGLSADPASSFSYFNEKVFPITVIDADTFSLDGQDSTGLSTFQSGGTVRKLVGTVAGLDHLEGETVAVMGDGADLGDATVSGGEVTLSSKAAVVHVGYSYSSRAQLQRFEAGSADGTALGKIRRTHFMGLFLYRTLGLKFGMAFTKLQNIISRKPSDQNNLAPPLFSGILRQQRPKADYDTENQICLQQDRPYPGTILAVMPQLMTQDDG